MLTTLTTATFRLGGNAAQGAGRSGPHLHPVADADQRVFDRHLLQPLAPVRLVRRAPAAERVLALGRDGDDPARVLLRLASGHGIHPGRPEAAGGARAHVLDQPLDVPHAGRRRGLPHAIDHRRLTDGSGVGRMIDRGGGAGQVGSGASIMQP